jgi:hypothetical protein
MRSPIEQKADAELLLRSARKFAERMLREFGEFLPYGELMRLDGRIVSVGAAAGEEKSSPKELVATLRKSYRKEAQAGAVLACAVIYDVTITPPQSDQKKSAIAFEIDHRDGYSAEVFFPYVLSESREILFDPPFAQRGADEIFSRNG